MKVRYVDTHDNVGGFQIEADNETELTILSLFIRASETGMRAQIHSCAYDCDHSAVTSILFGLVNEVNDKDSRKTETPSDSRTL